jgi:hypothetical protein
VQPSAAFFFFLPSGPISLWPLLSSIRLAARFPSSRFQIPDVSRLECATFSRYHHHISVISNMRIREGHITRKGKGRCICFSNFKLRYFDIVVLYQFKWSVKFFGDETIARTLQDCEKLKI